jgi:hypothetical protein
MVIALVLEWSVARLARVVAEAWLPAQVVLLEAPSQGWSASLDE